MISVQFGIGAAELDTMIYLVSRLDMANRSDIANLEAKTTEASKITYGLYRSPKLHR